jgi:hypothetical protein
MARAKRRKAPKVRLDDPRLTSASDNVRSAHRALRSNGHAASCACQICHAVRLMLSAFGTLGQIAEEQRRAEDKNQAGG